MKVATTVNKLQKMITGLNLSPLGFVPTMGALHNGHLSLVQNAVRECPMVVVSIYVNPTQFNDKEDLRNYPRTFEADLRLLRQVLRKNDIVFNPDDKEIYPHEDKRIFHFGTLEKVMEAARRPGHFNGVAQVVSRLFEIVKPDVAYFGLKDLQQVAIIRELVKQTGDNVRIVGKQIVREPDGLAMSSRNKLLEPDLRAKAPVIYKTLMHAAEMISDHDIPEIREYVKNTIGKNGLLRVEYFEIVDDKKFIPVNSKNDMKTKKTYYGCVAVKAGKIRLIDNIEIPLV